MEKSDKEEIIKEQDVSTSAQLLRLFMQRLMGRSLDYARISGMSDRSFEQYRKNVKDDFYNILQHFTTLFEQLERHKK